MAIGNFDGLHRGHRALIEEAGKIAQSCNLPLSVLTFEPHPRQLFVKDAPPFRLTPQHVKQRLLRDMGVDLLYTLHFDGRFSMVLADDFIRDYIVCGFAPRHIVVGQDFHFGQGREGNLDMLKEASARYNFKVDGFEQVMDSNFEVYSSSRVRDALRAGDIALANKILGWQWEIEGEVIEGDKRGRELGYPTANIALNDYLQPSFGVYAVRVAIDDFSSKPKWLPAVANLGIRPMFKTPAPLLEVHLFDFDKDIYGHILRVQLVRKLRNEEKFDSLETLKTAIEKDCQNARALFAAITDVKEKVKSKSSRIA